MIVNPTPEAWAQATSWPQLTEEDEEAVLRVLRSGAVSVNAETGRLEDDVRAWLGVKHAIAHNNGTACLHSAMAALELEPGDEVIVQSSTWWSTVMPILHQGAVPVFAEMESETLGLDPLDVERKITPRTRALIVVHLFGVPSQMDALLALAEKHGLLVIEDASHAHGATYRGRLVGTLGHAAIFSLQGNKLVPTAEGGVLVTDDDAFAERVIRYGHRERLAEFGGSEARFAATGFGHKYRMSPLSAAMGRVQLKHLAARNQRRSENCLRLSKRLEPLGFDTFMVPGRVHFEFIVRPPASLSRSELSSALAVEGAQAKPLRYPLVHEQPVFTEGTWASIARATPDLAAIHCFSASDLPHTTADVARLMRLPCFPQADHKLLDRYAEAFEKVVGP